MTSRSSKHRAKAPSISLCPCGSGAPAEACCARWSREKPAPDAEALMRSRYCAYVATDAAWLLATWHASTRPAALNLADGAKTQWLGLQVLRYEQHAADRASVEFIARYKLGGRAQRLHEISRFVFEDGRWFYVDGSFSE